MLQLLAKSIKVAFVFISLHYKHQDLFIKSKEDEVCVCCYHGLVVNPAFSQTQQNNSGICHKNHNALLGLWTSESECIRQLLLKVYTVFFCSTSLHPLKTNVKTVCTQNTTTPCHIPVYPNKAGVLLPKKFKCIFLEKKNDHPQGSFVSRLKQKKACVLLY